MTVQISVLGPIETTVDGSIVRLGGRRPISILVILLLAHGTAVDPDRIIDSVWQDWPPGKPRQNLHTHIRALRRALEPDRRPRQHAEVLVRRPAGYALEIEREALDFRRFTALAAQGSAALYRGQIVEALTTLDAALGLWRGRAFADVADAGFVQPEVARLEELRVAVREDHALARLASGDSLGALLEAEALTAEHALREQGWGIRALALYRGQRQAEAFAALDSIRRRLRDELGVDPGPTVTRLATMMLRHDPALVHPQGWRALAASRQAHS